MDPGEPNGDARRATPLELGKETQLAILPAGDQDYFRVELPAAGMFHVDAIDVPQRLGIAFRLLEGDHDLGAGPNWAISKKGFYLLRVGDNNNDAGSPTPFLLEGTFTAK